MPHLLWTKVGLRSGLKKLTLGKMQVILVAWQDGEQQLECKRRQGSEEWGNPLAFRNKNQRPTLHFQLLPDD